MKAGLEPLANKDSSILILGTMPADDALKAQAYYSNPENQFWHIVCSVLNEPFTTDYAARVDLLTRHKIALWDVIRFCEKKGSTDATIANQVANDFESFYASHPNIKHVIFTSNKAAAYYNEYIGKKPERTYYLLPSPNKANAWLSLTGKIKEWKLLLQLIEQSRPLQHKGRNIGNSNLRRTASGM